MHNNLTVHKIILAQILVTASLSGSLYLWVTQRAAYAAFVGGVISALAGLYFARRVFRYDSSASPHRILRTLYIGEVVKIAMTAGLLTVAIVALKVDVLYLLLGYGATLPVYWFALLWSPPT